MEVSPVIKGGKVVRLVVCGLPWPLKSEIPVEEFLKLVESIYRLAEYVDLARIGEGARGGAVGARASWSRAELEAFLRERSEAQREFLRLLAEKGEVSRRELLGELRSRLGRPDYAGKDLAGLVAGINRRISSLGKEPLFSIERRRIEGKIDGIYKINPHYRALLSEVLADYGPGKA